MAKGKALEPLRPQLKERCAIYLEEKSYSHAISIYKSLLTNADDGKPVAIPPVQVLRLLATLAVHTSTTSRAPSAEVQQASEQALTYLYHLVSRLGPSDSTLHEALTFIRPRPRSVSPTKSSFFAPSSTRRSTRQQPSTPSARENPSASDFEDRDVANALAHRASLFERAPDFWAVVGWSFNSAVRHRHRWRFWEKYLQFALEVLERDWACALASVASSSSNHPPSAKHPPSEQPAQPDATLGEDAQAETCEARLSRTLIAQYLRPSSIAEASSWRRIARAILANGDAQAVQEFGEIWSGETKRLKSEAERLEEEKQRRKRKRLHLDLDLDEGKFGDYDGEEDPDSEGEGDVPGSRRASARTGTKRGSAKGARGSDASKALEKDDEADPAGGPAGSIESHGGFEAFVLRRRIVVLILSYLTHLPTPTLTPSTFTSLLTPSLHLLPLPLFTLWISPTPTSSISAIKDPIPSAPHISLLHWHLLIPLLPSKATALALKHSNFEPDQHLLETALLPSACASSTPRDGARMAALLEGMLRGAWRRGALSAKGGALRAAAEAGIAVRDEGRRARAGTDADGGVDEWVRGAERQMRLLVERMERDEQEGGSAET